MACLPCLGQRARGAQSSAEPCALQPNCVARVWATEASDQRCPKRWPLPVTASSKAALAANARAEPCARVLRAWAASSRQLGQPSARGHVFCLAAAAALRVLCGRPVCLGARDAAGWNWQRLVRRRRICQAWACRWRGPRARARLTAWLAVGPCPRDASGRFSAEVACQHGLWLAPAFAAGFKRGWRGESRGDAKRRVGSTDATEILRCSRGVPLKMHVHHKRVPTVGATPWCASEKGVGLLAATRSIFGAPGQAWRRSTVGGGGTTDS